jgi:hypothetical protein
MRIQPHARAQLYCASCTSGLRTPEPVHSPARPTGADVATRGAGDLPRQDVACALGALLVAHKHSLALHTAATSCAGGGILHFLGSEYSGVECDSPSRRLPRGSERTVYYLRPCAAVAARSSQPHGRERLGLAPAQVPAPVWRVARPIATGIAPSLHVACAPLRRPRAARVCLLHAPPPWLAWTIASGHVSHTSVRRLQLPHVYLRSHAIGRRGATDPPPKVPMPMRRHRHCSVPRGHVRCCSVLREGPGSAVQMWRCCGHSIRCDDVRVAAHLGGAD